MFFRVPGFAEQSDFELAEVNLTVINSFFLEFAALGGISSENVHLINEVQQKLDILYQTAFV